MRCCALNTRTPNDHLEPDDPVDPTFQRLVDDGELVPVATFLKRLGLTEQALTQATQAGRLFFLEVRGVQAYPSFVFDTKYDRTLLESVSQALGSISGGSKWLFFTTSKGSLALPNNGTPRTPLEALRSGDIDAVRRAAIGFSQR